MIYHNCFISCFTVIKEIRYTAETQEDIDLPLEEMNWSRWTRKTKFLDQNSRSQIKHEEKPLWNWSIITDLPTLESQSNPMGHCQPCSVFQQFSCLLKHYATLVNCVCPSTVIYNDNKILFALVEEEFKLYSIMGISDIFKMRTETRLFQQKTALCTSSFVTPKLTHFTAMSECLLTQWTGNNVLVRICVLTVGWLLHFRIKVQNILAVHQLWGTSTGGYLKKFHV